MSDITTLRDLYVGKVILFKHAADELEAYPEGGMRARVVYLSEGDMHGGGSDVCEMKVDYSEFDEVNQKYETPNYYMPFPATEMGTAREAGDYHVTELLFLDGENRDWSKYFVLDDDAMTYLTRLEDASGPTCLVPRDGVVVKYQDAVVQFVTEEEGCYRYHYQQGGNDLRQTLDDLEVYKLTRVL